MKSINRSVLFLVNTGCVLALSMPVSLASDLDWAKNLADGYQQLSMGNTEKAVDIFSHKVSKYPSSAACHTALGRAYKRLGKIDDAKSEFRKATELDASFPDGFYELGVIQESDKNWAEAASAFEAYLRLKPDASQRQALGDRIRYCRSQSPSISEALPPSTIDTVPTTQSPSAPVINPSMPIAQATSPAATVTTTTSVVNEAVTKPTTTVKLADASSKQVSGVINSDSSSKQDSAPDINKPIRDKWAVIIGIGTFANSNIPHLKYATKDARDLYSYLVHEANFAPDHVRLILDEKATERRIMSEVGSKFLARLAKPDDLIVLFFSTHGSPSTMDIRGKNYIVAYDSDPDDLFATGIEMQKILESIQSRVLSDRVLLVLDACHSGGVDPNAKGLVRTGNFDAQELAEGSGQMVICSSRPDQQSWESKRYQNGVFTRNLLEGLRKAGSKGSLAKAFTTMQELVADEVREDHPGARQTPMLQSKWNGNELIISIPANSPQRIPPTVSSELEPDSSSIAAQK